MPGQLIALLDNDSLTLRSADGAPLVMPALSIADAFEMALAAQASPVEGLEPSLPGLLLYAGHDEWQAHQNEIDALRDRFTGREGAVAAGGPDRRARARRGGGRRRESDAGRRTQ